jgi:NADPH2:quinone reductase
MVETAIPTQMQALVLHNYDDAPGSLVYSERPVPRLKPGQVLIKIHASPVNPSDLVFMKGAYGVIKPVPVIPGFEASGTVVASGGGWLGRLLTGRRVACKAPKDGDGTWAEYMAAPAEACIPLFNHISNELGACLIVNPMTAYALIQLAIDGGHAAFVQTAAAGALGVMLGRLGKRRRLTGIHVVRRAEQVKKLKDLGFDYVFDTTDVLFDERLGEACYKFKARIAFDAVAGELTRRIATAMPTGARLVIYGALSGQSCQVSPVDLIFHNEKLEGFWLSEWIKTKSFPQKLWFASRVQAQLTGDLETSIQRTFPLSRFAEAIDFYKKNRTEGKVLLQPSAGN